MINALNFDSILVGASVFKHYYTVWDLGGQQVGFSPAVNDSRAVPNTATSSSGSKPTGNVGSGVRRSYSPTSILVFAGMAVLAGGL